VIIARSAPGYPNQTLIRGRNAAGVLIDVIAWSPYVSWQWSRDEKLLRVDCSTGHFEFPIKPPFPGWKFAITLSGGGPQPLYTTHSVMGFNYDLSRPCTLVITEAVATGAVLLPSTSTRHIVLRHEVGL